MIFIEEGIFSEDQMSLLRRQFNKKNSNCSEVDYFIVGHKTKLSEDFFKSFKSKTSKILSLTTGITHIDNEVWLNPDRKIETLKNPLFKDFLESTHSTSELALYHIYALIRAIAKIKRTPNVHIYLENRPKGRELSALNCGIIGYGRIGSRVAAYLAEMCLEVFFYDTADKSKQQNIATPLDSIEELVEQSEVIILATNYQIESGPVLDESFFRQINEPKYIINISRGELVDFYQLECALRSGLVLGYASDVFLQENSNSINDYERLFDMQQEGYNISLTPHIGGNTVDAHNKLFSIANKFLKDF